MSAHGDWCVQIAPQVARWTARVENHSSGLIEGRGGGDDGKMMGNKNLGALDSESQHYSWAWVPFRT